MFAPIVAPQTMGPQPATAAAAGATNVRGVPQYKYAAGMRNSQQHMTAQPQVPMQQVLYLPSQAYYVILLSCAAFQESSF